VTSPVDAYIAAARLFRIDLSENDVWWTDAKGNATLLSDRYDQIMTALKKTGGGVGLPWSVPIAMIVEGAAKNLGISCVADATLRARAQAAVDAIDADFERRRKSGDLKAINRNYRDSRIKGRRLPNWAEWVKHIKRRACAEHAHKNRLKLLAKREDPAIAATPGANNDENVVAREAN
jgi:hypothetical protein